MMKPVYPYLAGISGLLVLIWGLCVVNTGFLSNWSLSIGVLALPALFATLIAYTRKAPRLKSEPATGPDTDIENADRFLKTVLDNIPIAICVFDENFKVVDWNRNYLSFTDLDESELYRGKRYEDILRHHFKEYTDEGEDSDEFIKRNLADTDFQAPAQYERKMKSGRILELTRKPLPSGGFVMSFADVTDQRRAETLLRESEVRYRRMVDLSPDAILVHQQGFIIYANNALVKLFKVRNLHDLIGRQIKEFFSLDSMHQLKQHFGDAADFEVGQVIPSTSSDLICEDGSIVRISMEAATLLYGDKKVLQLILRDVTVQTRAQDLLLSARDKAEQADQIKTTFLANMSHELRTPLNAIIGFSEIISKEIFGPSGSEKYVEYADDIHASGTHLLDLINDILDYSKIESGVQSMYEETENLGKIIVSSVKVVRHKAEQNDLDISFDFTGEDILVRLDAKMLKQVMLNLLSNAVKFTPPGGKIIVSVKHLEDGGCAIAVADNGIGIKAEDIGKALTPFVQIDSELSRKFDGTGLGLPLSRDLIELHGGTLELTSGIGEGTTVVISLPATRIMKPAP